MIFLVQFRINKHLRIFSKTTNCTHRTGSCNFVSLWKNLVVLIYSKLHSKSCDYYTNLRDSVVSIQLMLWPCYHYRDEINCSNILVDRSCVLTCDILIVRKPIKRSNPLAFYKFAIVVISLFSGPHVTLMRFFNHRGSNLSLLIGVWRQNCVCFIVASTHLVKPH